VVAPPRVSKKRRRFGRDDRGVVAKTAWRLGSGKGEVDGEGDVVAEFGPGVVGAELDAGDQRGPVAGEEDVVDVIGTIFVVPEEVGGPSLLALGLGKEMMVSADEAAFR